jgi:hypothetical protein
MQKTYDVDGLISYLEGMISALKDGGLEVVSFGTSFETREAPSLEDADLTSVVSGDSHHHVHLRDRAQAASLAALRNAYDAGGGRSVHLFDVDPSEFGPSKGIMPIDDPGFNVFAAGAAHVLKKRLEDVTEHERHRFRMAYLNAFSVMAPSAHEEMAVLRQDEKFATPAQSVGF